MNTSYALYHFLGCPYCAATRAALKELDLKVELRNIRDRGNHRRDLIAGGGKGQVPCLRIAKDNGEVDWLYESADIIRYLRALAERQVA